MESLHEVVEEFAIRILDGFLVGLKDKRGGAQPVCHLFLGYGFNLLWLENEPVEHDVVRDVERGFSGGSVGACDGHRCGGVGCSVGVLGDMFV